MITITRLLPEVIKEQSYLEDSHQQGLLKYPQYTRPQKLFLNQYEVPAVLLSGNLLQNKDVGAKKKS
ncbi:hypothetical protein ACEW7V_01410 [Areca yellow leaf disease phytoplasma]|uniref:hypothetical protein n=1 Tax=Areca yellow leaf disease phytoplasma TaxID=927614 RepID=UPI0035B4FC83